MENYCWIHYTYSIDEKAALTRDFVRGANGSHRTPYYIWIPYIFLLAALCTYLPAWFWHAFGHRAIFDIPALMNQISKMDLNNIEDRLKNLSIIAQHYRKAHRYTQTETHLINTVCRRMMSTCMWFAGGGTLTGIYLLVKLCYLINAIGQFLLLNSFLQLDIWSYGQNVVLGLIRGSDWMENKSVFPRIVFCDFTIRYLGDNNPNYTVNFSLLLIEYLSDVSLSHLQVQCTLPVNLYNERIFALYWFWLLLLACLTLYGIFVWLIQMSYRNRRRFLKKHLRLSIHWELNDDNRALFSLFIDEYLGGDGILFLRLVAKNTNAVVTGERSKRRMIDGLFHCDLGELLSIMWEDFITKERVVPVVTVFDVDTFLNGRETIKIE